MLLPSAPPFPADYIPGWVRRLWPALGGVVPDARCRWRRCKKPTTQLLTEPMSVNAAHDGGL